MRSLILISVFAFGFISANEPFTEDDTVFFLSQLREEFRSAPRLCIPIQSFYRESNDQVKRISFWDVKEKIPSVCHKDNGEYQIFTSEEITSMKEACKILEEQTEMFLIEVAIEVGGGTVQNPFTMKGVTTFVTDEEPGISYGQVDWTIPSVCEKRAVGESSSGRNKRGPGLVDTACQFIYHSVLEVLKAIAPMANEKQLSDIYYAKRHPDMTLSQTRPYFRTVCQKVSNNEYKTTSQSEADAIIELCKKVEAANWK